MNSWPTLREYNQALMRKDLSQALGRPDLEGSSIQTNAYGLPNALSGGFAYIYQLTLKDGNQKAFRLFHSLQSERIGDLRRAYHLVGQLRSTNPELRPYFIDAQWINGSLIETYGTVPAILMDWVNDPVLSSWLEKNHTQKQRLRGLRNKLLALQNALESSQIIHGDIQANNIAVGPRNRIILLDYDSVSTWNDFNSRWETGHIHFQHPDPQRQVEAVDRFPFLVLDLGLALLEWEPQLFQHFSQGENVLFTADDFSHPRESPLIQQAASLPAFSRSCELFIAICEGPASGVPTLEQFHEIAQIPDNQEESAKTIQISLSYIPSSGAINAPETSSRSISPNPYRSVYPVYSPSTFLTASPALVGQRIELIGWIIDIKTGKTKYGAPYVFVNFNDWRSGGIKLIFWSEGLSAFGDQQPDRSWIGRWISATGMVDEPYLYERLGVYQYSITITDPSQVRFIPEGEAKRRLGTDTQSLSIQQTPKTLSNTELLRRLTPPSSSPSATNGFPVRQQSGNTPGQRSKSSGSWLYVLGILGFIFWLIFSRMK